MVFIADDVRVSFSELELSDDELEDRCVTRLVSVSDDDDELVLADRLAEEFERRRTSIGQCLIPRRVLLSLLLRLAFNILSAWILRVIVGHCMAMMAALLRFFQRMTGYLSAWKKLIRGRTGGGCGCCCRRWRDQFLIAVRLLLAAILRRSTEEKTCPCDLPR